MSPALSANVTSVVRRDLAASVPTPAPAPAPTAIVGDTAPGTVRLAPFRVHDDRTPKISASDILTTAGKIALARKRYPGLVGPGSAGLALQLYEQDLLVAQREELIEDGALLTFDHPEASKAEKRKIYDTLLGTRHQGP